MTPRAALSATQDEELEFCAGHTMALAGKWPYRQQVEMNLVID